MLSREDFAFTIGYDGDRAVVDGRAKAEFGRLSTMELAAKGLYRAAFASALWLLAQEGNKEKAEAEMKAFIEYFNGLAHTTFSRPEELQRLFGVAVEKVSRTLVL